MVLVFFKIYSNIQSVLFMSISDDFVNLENLLARLSEEFIEIKFVCVYSHSVLLATSSSVFSYTKSAPATSYQTASFIFFHSKSAPYITSSQLNKVI